MGKIKVILIGATEMVGEGVLLECLQNEKVEQVLMVNRKHFDISHPKLKELIVADFFIIENFKDQLKGYNASFWCAGKTSIGMTEEAYTKLTYDTTLHFACVLKEHNPAMVFNFVSGGQTDSTEKGKVMWARIKGKTENTLMRMFPEKENNFRPALMKPMKGQKNFYGYNRMTHKIMFPIMSLFFPSCSIQQIAQAMINAAIKGYEKSILEVKDIKDLAAKS